MILSFQFHEQVFFFFNTYPFNFYFAFLYKKGLRPKYHVPHFNQRELSLVFLNFWEELAVIFDPPIL